MCSSLQCLANIYHRVVKTILDDILQIAFALRSSLTRRSLLDALIDLLVEQNVCRLLSWYRPRNGSADDWSVFAKSMPSVPEWALSTQETFIELNSIVLNDLTCTILVLIKIELSASSWMANAYGSGTQMRTKWSLEAVFCLKIVCKLHLVFIWSITKAADFHRKRAFWKMVKILNTLNKNEANSDSDMRLHCCE